MNYTIVNIIYNYTIYNYKICYIYNYTIIQLNELYNSKHNIQLYNIQLYNMFTIV